MIALLALLACHSTQAPAPAKPDLASRVAWAKAEVPEEVPVATLPAEVVSAPGARHDLAPAVSGRLVRWHVSPGEAVVAGAPLADLQSPELSALEARISELDEAVRQGERRVALRKTGAERGVASAADVQEAEAQLADARAMRDGTRRQLGALRDTTTREGGTWTWRAPADGVVGEIRCALGTVEPAMPCVSLVRPEGVLLEVRVPERFLDRLDAPVAARFHGASGATATFAELTRAPVIDRATRSRTLHFAPTGESPLPGASGRAVLLVPAAPDVVQVPATALTRIDAVPTVFVRNEDAGEPRPVEVIGRTGDDLVVRGLASGDEVAVKGVFLLKSLALLEEG
ncbi:MAG: efflux RND transporter periplasmic adaptor subunit [Alphaproteobacteria bacterium]|nr:efflux RND transporter periplasmic adaptor subunit [Alphaproteobacteria bacterium]